MKTFHTILAAAIAIWATIMIAGTAQSNDIEHSYATDGLLVYYGLVPAQVLRNFPAGSEEAVAHQHVPVGQHLYHLVVAVFEERGMKRVTDARLSASIHEPGLPGVQKPLAPTVLAGDLTFCNFFTLADHQDYRIEIGIQRPDNDKVVTAVFNYMY